MLKSFILGKCKCGCNEDIPIYDFTNKNFRTYKFGHHHKDPTKKNWKGGRRIHNKGYIEIYVGLDKNKRRYKFEHRLIYEQYYNCCLLSWTDIHHKDGNKLNNLIENLQPVYHNNHFNISRDYQKIPSSRVCFNCNSNKTYISKKGYSNWRIYNNKYICIKCYYYVNKYGICFIKNHK